MEERTFVNAVLNTAVLLIIVITITAMGFYHAMVEDNNRMTYANRKEIFKLKDLVTREIRRSHADIIKQYVRVVTITGYSSDEAQTDSTPYTSAFMTKVTPGTIAVTWHMIEDGWVPGACVYLGAGIGVRKINDTLAPWWGNQNRIDIWFHSREDALRFGRKDKILAVMILNCQFKI